MSFLFLLDFRDTAPSSAGTARVFAYNQFGSADGSHTTAVFKLLSNSPAKEDSILMQILRLLTG